MREVNTKHVFPQDPNKTYGLMELMKGTKPTVGLQPDDMVFTWPHLLIRELVLFAIVVAGLLVAAFLFDAPLEEIANPNHPPNPAKAPWYFLGLQELVSYSAFVGGVLIPTLIVIGLMLIPFIDRKKIGIGKWFAKERALANGLFLTFLLVMGALIILGTYFRGANWSFVVPWE
ncbi:MAG: menaquinol oxidoreductase [Bacteroidetes bacterium]|nr:MAG: menaquinol oxidoreductase [Bacteroidota bacterium]